jgi:hypothetical protein
VTGLAVLVAVGAFVLWPRTDPTLRITRENFDGIKEGMSREEVEAILGPEGDYTTGPVDFPSLQQWGFLEELRDATFLAWVTDTAWVSIALNEPGGVVRTRFVPIQRFEQGPLDNLRWRAKRQWRQWWYPEIPLCYPVDAPWY